MFRRGKMSAAFELAAFNLGVHEHVEAVASSGVYLISESMHIVSYDTSPWRGGGRAAPRRSAVAAELRGLRDRGRRRVAAPLVLRGRPN